MFKRIIAVNVLGVSALGMMTANATTNGVYVTGQLGYAQRGNELKVAPGIPSDVTINTAKNKKANLAGRLAIGYQFNPNFAVEAGYLQLGQQKSNFASKSLKVTQSVTINQHALDVVGKGIYPLSDKFNVYAKAGMAYLATTVKGDTKAGSSSIIAPIAKHNWAPEAGIGFTYNMTSNVFIDTSITHIQAIGKNKPSNINFAAVGIGYSFG